VALYNPLATPEIMQVQAEHRIPLALDVLRQFVPGAPEPIQAVATDWMDDPLSRGSYSYIPLGATADDMRALARPASPHLAFAGEHTVATYFGTVHAAYVSGLRAADWARQR
jgi:monoamine oxidase